MAQAFCRAGGFPVLLRIVEALNRTYCIDANHDPSLAHTLLITHLDIVCT